MNRLGIEGRRKALEWFGEGRSPREVLEKLGPFAEEVRKELDPEKELALCWEKRISLLTILDPAYPASLKEIPDPPLLLYVKGEIAENDSNALAVVGTRHPSFYGRTQAKRFAGELAAKGLTIVSGLARGVDQAAHEAALDVSYGRTLAVLGSGLDVIYPRENEKLYHRIIERGAVLSEYAPGTPPLAENFPRRNRILSGLSLGVFVVEAHSRSGSLITAHQALDQGREVFALPGPVDQLTSRGTHQLLREGAALVENPEDIFEALSARLKQIRTPVFTASLKTDIAGKLPDGNKGPVAEPEDPVLRKEVTVTESDCHQFTQALQAGKTGDIFSEEEAVIWEAIKEEKALGPDEILDITGLNAGKLPGLLLKLELAGRIKRGQDGKYALQ